MTDRRGAIADPRPRSVLLVHNDSIVLDYLGQVLDTRGYSVDIALAVERAFGEMRGREFDVVLADWDTCGGATGDLFGVFDKSVATRSRFAFLGSPRDDAPDGVAIVDPWNVEEVIRLVDSIVRRGEEQAEAELSETDMEWLDTDRPTMLLVDDGALELMAMSRVLGDFGFDVTAVDSGNAAIAQLGSRDFHVILSDWYMTDGSGADLYKWILENRPNVAKRCVFISGGAPKDFEEIAPGRPLMPKGQDSPQLIQTLMDIVRSEGK